ERARTPHRVPAPPAAQPREQDGRRRLRRPRPPPRGRPEVGPAADRARRGPGPRLRGGALPRGVGGHPAGL
ncbi:MAG: hypothetical protein AVDCRST_MAG06-1426, partial [uncultured Nocardioides sp.]